MEKGGEEEKAQEMEKEMARHDPIEMKEEIEKRLKQVWEMKESLEAAEAKGEGAEAPPGESPGKKQRQKPKEQRAKRSPLNRVS